MSTNTYSRRIIAFALAAVVLACGCQELFNQRAKEGHGVLARPSALSGGSTGVASKFAFRQESPHVYSRVLFETAEASDFNFRIQEFSLPPRQGLTTIHLHGDALLEMRTDHGTLIIGNKEQVWKQGATLLIPAEVPFQLANPTDRELIVRLDVLEGK